MQTAAYDEDAFRQALAAIRGMTEYPPEKFYPAMRTLCAEAGVAFCVVQELPKSGANGATRWLSPQKALIQMSLRHKWADIFWFSFFHEACHLLNHRRQRRAVIDGLNSDPDMATIEAEADRFARDILIPPREWSEFRNSLDFYSKLREGICAVGQHSSFRGGWKAAEGRFARLQAILLDETAIRMGGRIA